MRWKFYEASVVERCHWNLRFLERVPLSPPQMTNCHLIFRVISCCSENLEGEQRWHFLHETLKEPHGQPVASPSMRTHKCQTVTARSLLALASPACRGLLSPCPVLAVDEGSLLCVRFHQPLVIPFLTERYIAIVVKFKQRFDFPVNYKRRLLRGQKERKR